MNKPGMDEYKEIGAEFKRLRIELGNLAMKVSEASGKTKNHSRNPSRNQELNRLRLKRKYFKLLSILYKSNGQLGDYV